MIVVFDASVLIFLFEKNASGPIDPKTGLILTRCYDRVNQLVKDLVRERAIVIIPAPALAEILVKAGAAGPEWLRIINESRSIRIADFDQRAAVEFAAAQNDRKQMGSKATETKAKAKFDDQIIAIARVAGADVIYSYDEGLTRAAAPGIKVLGLVDLPLPAEERQPSLFQPPDDSQPTKP